MRTYLSFFFTFIRSYLFKVVDGTTLFLENDVKKINNSPPANNTPENIQPTQTATTAGGVTSAADSNVAADKTPEIESSVLSPEFQVNNI